MSLPFFVCFCYLRRVARQRLFDVLQDSYFWAFDATTELAVPVFNPLFGFSRITGPEINVEVESFKDGTFLYPRHVVKGAEVGAVMFERASTMFDADFYDWIIYTIHGNKDFEEGGTLGKVTSFLSGGGRTTFRRTIIVVQFARINLGKLVESDNPLVRTGPAIGGAAAGAIAGDIIGGATGAAQGAAFSALAVAGLGPFQFATRLPARAWVLHGCIPIHYKATTDLDAASGQVSLQELEVQPEYIEELSLGIKP